MQVDAGTKCTGCGKEIKVGHNAVEGKRGNPYCTGCQAVAHAAAKEQDVADAKAIKAREEKAAKEAE